QLRECCDRSERLLQVMRDDISELAQLIVRTGERGGPLDHLLLQPAVELADFLLGPLAVGNIADGVNGNDAFRGVQGAAGDFSRKGSAVCPDTGELALECGLRLTGPSWNQSGYGSANQLIALPLEERFGAAVDHADPAVRSGEHLGVGGRL